MPKIVIIYHCNEFTFHQLSSCLADTVINVIHNLTAEKRCFIFNQEPRSHKYNLTKMLVANYLDFSNIHNRNTRYDATFSDAVLEFQWQFICSKLLNVPRPIITLLIYLLCAITPQSLGLGSGAEHSTRWRNNRVTITEHQRRNHFSSDVDRVILRPLACYIAPRVWRRNNSLNTLITK